MIQTLFQNPWVKDASEHSPLAPARNKLSFFFLFCLLLFLPTQLGFHTWPSWAYVNGMRVDYLSPTLFLTDIFVLALFLLNAASFLTLIRLWHACVLLFLALGIFVSSSPAAGWYGIVKLCEFTFLGWYISRHAYAVWEMLRIAFPINLLVESMLGIWQFFLQHSIGGLWYVLGERTFSAATPGIANASLNGHLILRPYATFPHPNVLAGFLLVGLVFIVLQFSYEPKVRKAIYILVLLVGSIALGLSLSRSAIVLGFSIGLGSLIAFLSQKTKGMQIGIGLLGVALVVVVWVLLYPRFTGINITGESLLQREELLSASWQIFLRSPLLGVGVNNFLVVLPKVAPTLPVQPVHNIYLFVLSQTGVLGFGLFIFASIHTVKRLLRLSFAGHLRKNIRTFTIISLGIVFGIGFVDHYFLTLQQGQLITAVIFGLAWQAKEKYLQ